MLKWSPTLIPRRSVLGAIDEVALGLVRATIGRLRKSDVAVFVTSEIPAQPHGATVALALPHSAEGRNGHGSPGQLPAAPSDIRAAVSKAALRAQLVADFEKVSALLRAVLNVSQSFFIAYSSFIIDSGLLSDGSPLDFFRSTLCPYMKTELLIVSGA